MTSETNDARILIADDIPRNLQLLGNLLTSKGYKIAAVTKGEQVVPSVEKFDPDLILLDVMMPDKNGFEVCKELQNNEKYAGIPIIFLTGKAEQEDVIKGLEIGGSDYITKPFDTGELLVRVKTHVALKQSKDKISLQNKQLEQLNATKDTLYSVIGHDLKNALFGAHGFADMLVHELEENSVEEPMQKKAQYIFTSTQKMSRLLENLLDWAQLQTGTLKLSSEPFSVARTIDEAIYLLQSSANLKEVTLNYEGPEEAEATGDQHVIETVVRNLLSNAIKFSKEGDPVEIKLERAGSSWNVGIRDYGIGMKPEVKNDLFNPGHRPIHKGTGNEQGTGLGLILCKDLMEKYQGSIRAESEAGKGTYIEITFPDTIA